MGRGTKTTEILKECMADSLLKLMQNKPVSKISAQDITDGAGVSRVTWFRNFSSKEDAIAFKIVQAWNRWLEEHEFDKSIVPGEQRSAELFFSFNYSIQKLLTVIYEQHMQSALYQAFYEVIMQKENGDVMKRYQSRFYAHGIVGLLDEWVKRQFRETPQEMIQLARRGL